jgi:CMP/dCMP kinase
MPDSSRVRLAYLNSRPRDIDHTVQSISLPPACPTIAMAAQTGSGAIEIAESLCEHFRAHSAAEPPWRVIASEDLIAKVLEDHHLPTGLAKVLPEDAGNPVDDAIYELFGLHPPSWMIVQGSVETIRKLAQAGNLVLVGWGVNVITRNLPNVLHVRLVGSVERRIARIEARLRLTRKEALAYVEQSDRGRARYVKRHFQQQVSDVLLYDLTSNTDHWEDWEVVHLIGDVLLTRCRQSGPPKRVSPETQPAPHIYGSRRL